MKKLLKGATMTMRTVNPLLNVNLFRKMSQISRYKTLGTTLVRGVAGCNSTYNH